ncbi:C-type lectin domain family 2 member B isoform X2 [Anas platyrhynchos]|uniref:C-type lectin domain family 2 member B isoform X2 n=1 Tax=Anas platyrhynchos TaxID=8839 RepID=UPI000F7C9058|eukprot:XP_027326133.1 C-type lectin domain family 2 member B-like isoform X2 [Anas platyrhynchos]
MGKGAQEKNHPNQEEVLNPPRDAEKQCKWVVRLQSCSSHPQFSHMCPDMWIGFQSKCYYFSDNESNWNTSLENCKAMEASLTSIDSWEELAFIKRYMGQGNHWFGLQEEVNGQWRWTNGTAFNNWFEVWGGGPCAYLNQEISSALCHTEKYWICSRPNDYVLWTRITESQNHRISRLEETSRSSSPTSDLILTSHPLNHIPKLYI